MQVKNDTITYDRSVDSLASPKSMVEAGLKRAVDCQRPQCIAAIIVPRGTFIPLVASPRNKLRAAGASFGHFWHLSSEEKSKGNNDKRESLSLS